MSSRIAPLVEHPEHLETVARWLHGEFGSMNPGSTLESRLADLRSEMNREGIPITLIALEGRGDEENEGGQGVPIPVGTAALRHDDMHGREDLGPWLGSVFVAPNHRRQGVATALIREIEDRAAALGVGTLYLFTPDQEDYYARRGWATSERTEHEGLSVVIMEKEL